MPWIDVKNSIVEVVCASEVTNPSAPPIVGQETHEQRQKEASLRITGDHAVLGDEGFVEDRPNLAEQGFEKHLILGDAERPRRLGHQLCLPRVISSRQQDLRCIRLERKPVAEILK